MNYSIHTTIRLLHGSVRTLALLLALGSMAAAQDFFRELGTSRTSGGIGPVVPSEYGYTDTLPSSVQTTERPGGAYLSQEDEQKYNMAVGPVRMSVAVGVGMEWNDNIALSDNDRQSDFILRPLVNVDFLWPISELNTLRFSVGASWAKYFEHSELDSGGLILSPNSELKLVLQVAAFQITLRDRFSYQEEPYSVATLSNVAKYQRYENQAGIDIEWPVNEKLTLLLSYDHYNLWTTDDTFSAEDRAIDTVSFKPAYELSPGFKLGVLAAYSHFEYDAADRSPGDNLLVGPFIDWQITPVINAYLEVGFQSLTYDRESRYDRALFSKLNPGLRNLNDTEARAFTDSSDSDGVYFKFQLTHTPNDIFEHGLVASRTTELGFGSNYYDLYHIEYGATFKGIYHTEINPLVFYEYYETSGSFSENAHRAGTAVGIRHHLTNSITLGLDYRFLIKDSNLEDQNYYQNLVFLSLYYRF